MAIADQLRELRAAEKTLRAKVRLAEKLAGADVADAVRAGEHTELVKRRSRAAYTALAEIGPIPPVAHPKRKAGCRRNLLRFLTTYFPHSTGLRPLSADHRTVIQRMQRCILKGGRTVNAVYRAFAKTTIAENATLWATLYGHRQFALITGINKRASTKNITSIKRELYGNDLLLADFPEVCFPICKLDRKPQRCTSQTYNGKPTDMVWCADTVALPVIPDSRASNAAIMAVPFAHARGITFKRLDGVNARPDLILVDDPQDNKTARHPMQVANNLEVLSKDLVHSSGHASALAIVVNGTVIAKADMIEKLLDDPSWQGQRIKFMPKHADAHDTFWLKDYAAVRRSFDRNIPGDKERAQREATALYVAKRKTADAGCIISWRERYTAPMEISAIQHGYNVLIDDGPEVFASEYQNEPLDESVRNSLLTAALVASKTNGLARGVVPKNASHLSAYVDVHARLLYYVVSAWSTDFTGAVIDYGTYPRQAASYFAQETAPACMKDMLPGSTDDAWIAAGLVALFNAILGAKFVREDGSEMQVGKLLVDTHWGDKNILVKQVCRRHPQYPVRLFPAQGYGSSALRPELNALPLKDGTQRGLQWRVAPPQPGGDRWVTISTNWWKTMVANRLAMPLSTAGGIELFGLDPREHSLFADHCVAERPVPILAKGGEQRTLWDWPLPRPDNHWWDCLVGCAVGASMLGCQVPGMEREKKQRKSLAELMGKR
jgi:hypothetical protein